MNKHCHKVEEGERFPQSFFSPQNCKVLNFSCSTGLSKVLLEHNYDISFQAVLRMMECEQEKNVASTAVFTLHLAHKHCWRCRINTSNTTSNLQKKIFFGQRAHYARFNWIHFSTQRETAQWFRAKSNQLNPPGILITENWAFLP